MPVDVYMPFNSIEGDRRHNAFGFREVIRSLFTSGISPGPAKCFFVEAGGAWTIVLNPGSCVIEGAMGINTSAKAMAVAPPNGTHDRIDRVVLQVNENMRWVHAYIKLGEAAENPQPPPLQRDKDAYEISVAQIRVGRDATQITQGVITDERPHQSVCGFLMPIPPVDTESLFRQYDAKWEDFSVNVEADILAWLETTKTLTDEGENYVLAQVAAVKVEKADKDLQFFDVAVPASAWVADPEGRYEFYTYCADIPLAFVTEGMIPRVVFDAADATLGNYAPVAQTVAHGVRIYACTKPEAALLIPTITVERRVVQ